MNKFTLITLALVSLASCTPAKLAHKPTGPEIKCQVYGGPFCYPVEHPDPAEWQ